MKHQQYLRWCMTLLLTVLSFISVSAANKIGSVTEDNIVYELYDDSTSIVAGYYYNPEKIIIPKQIASTAYNAIFNVTSIGSSAFSFCSSLQSVVMNNVTSIKIGAFDYCTTLQTVEMNNVTSIGTWAFNNCASLQSVEMNNVTSIGNGAFNNCASLQSVEMNNVTSIGDQAFKKCTSLQTVEMNSVKSIGKEAFYNCTSLQTVGMKGVKSIGGSAFSYCSSLQSVEMNNVTYIGDDAFRNCSVLQSIIILNPNPPRLERWSSLYTGHDFVITIPFESRGKYIKSWDWNLFKLKYVHYYGVGIPVDVNVDAGNLMNCVDIENLSKIWSLKISGNINGSDLIVINQMENLGILDLSDCHIVSGGSSYYRKYSVDYYTEDDIFSSYSIRDLALDSISYPQVSVVELNAVGILGTCTHSFIPASITSFQNELDCQEYLFEYGDEELSITPKSINLARKVTLGRPVTYEDFFREANSTLQEVHITYPYTEFPNQFFYFCSELTSIRIPASILAIGRWTFLGCTGLKDVICCATTPPIAIQNMFSNSTYQNATLYVPVGTRTAYFFDPVWGMFANIVESEELTDGVDDVMVEDVDGPVSVYDLQGVQRYHGDRDTMPTLPHGIYIIRNSNGIAEKVAM